MGRLVLVSTAICDLLFLAGYDTVEPGSLESLGSLLVRQLIALGVRKVSLRSSHVSQILPGVGLVISCSLFYRVKMLHVPTDAGRPFSGFEYTAGHLWGRRVR